MAKPGKLGKPESWKARKVESWKAGKLMERHRKRKLESWKAVESLEKARKKRRISRLIGAKIANRIRVVVIKIS